MKIQFFSGKLMKKFWTRCVLPEARGRDARDPVDGDPRHHRVARLQQRGAQHAHRVDARRVVRGESAESAQTGTI